MLSGGENIILVLVAGEFLLGFLGNGFMVLVNGIDWIKSKKFATVDLILVQLAISRIGLLCTLISISSQLICCLAELLVNKPVIVDIFWILTHLASIWSGTCLSVFYFLKIANFSHPLFLWLKWRINQVILMLQVGPFLIALFINLLLFTKPYNFTLNRENDTKALPGLQMNRSQYIILQVIVNFLSLLPFSLSLISFFFLILSLWRHSLRMKLSGTGSKDSSTEAHVRAMKATFCFLFLFILFNLSISIAQWSHIIPNKKLAVMFMFPLMILYPSGHSLILILYNSKLRQAALKMWWQVRCYLKRKK
ncbi:taste receptor type 2 member 7-like [Sminthopsis crassicaudata]|uniref:taste receptor type 2 member 7-like n=1 Tax=Sminthopsis crassicaudata TaxID=9301 RepID=UPI003D695B16